MQTAQEIQSNLKNLRYYSDKIIELAKQQMDMDLARGKEIGINSGPGSIRFDCLGTIISACSWITTFCDNIDANMQMAIKQDKVLHTEDYAEEG